jgi:sugar-specific transcriptional regulator TrmB
MALDKCYGVQVKEDVRDDTTKAIQQLLEEIAVLRNELEHLKKDFDALKPGREESGRPSQEPVKGFFDAQSEDETIALSSDEIEIILDNLETPEIIPDDEEVELEEDLAVFPEDLYSGGNIEIEEEFLDEELPEKPSVEESFFSEETHGDETSEGMSSPDIPSETTPVEKLSPALLQDIKTVLSYLDTLLSGLPEDKVTEFANSPYFGTYKNLFVKLGLA